MCTCVEGRGIVAGWMCHECNIYNGLQRANCKQCNRARCLPLLPDKDTKRTFETYAEAYADDPETLARINIELEKAKQEGR